MDIGFSLFCSGFQVLLSVRSLFSRLEFHLHLSFALRSRDSHFRTSHIGLNILADVRIEEHRFIFVPSHDAQTVRDTAPSGRRVGSPRVRVRVRVRVRDNSQERPLHFSMVGSAEPNRITKMVSQVANGWGTTIPVLCQPRKVSLNRIYRQQKNMPLIDRHLSFSPLP